MLWATLRGHIFYVNGIEPNGANYLASHVSPFLLVFVLPFYALKQSPLTYLMLRVLGLSLAAIPLFYCVKRYTESAIAAMVPPNASFATNDGKAMAHIPVRWGLYVALIWDVPRPDQPAQGTDQIRHADYVLTKPFSDTVYSESKTYQFLTEPGGPYVKIYDRDGIKLYRRTGG